MIDDDTMNKSAVVYWANTELPCVDIHGVQVYTYVKEGVLRVSVHCDGDTNVWGESAIPLTIEVGETVVYTAR